MTITPSMKARIEAKLNKELAPIQLEVFDDSDLHKGHAGARPGGESHFRIELNSKVFVGMDRLARHRLVHRILAQEFDDGLHALQIRAVAPDEA